MKNLKLILLLCFFIARERENNLNSRKYLLILLLFFCIGLKAQKIIPDSLGFTNEISVAEFLQGRISGLDIISASGDPGRNSQMILRGQNLFGFNIPLIVIDGIPQIPLDDLFNNYNYGSSDIRSLIPVALEDILSIEVLKDVESASLYGTEGVNGVILIETKKGRSQKLGLIYQFNQSIVKEPSFPPMLSGEEYVMYQLEAWHNAVGVFEVPREIAYDRDYPDYYNYSANTDWIKAITRTGDASNHFLNVTGGNEKSKFYGSINFTDQKGNIINTGYNKLSGRLNFEQYITDKLTFKLKLSNNYHKYNGNVIVNNRDILDEAFVKAPNMSIWEYDSFGIPTGDYFSPINNYQGNVRNYYNPVAVSDIGKSENKMNDLITTGELRYNFRYWLGLSESFSYLRKSAFSESFLPRYAIPDEWLSHIPIVYNKSDLLSNQYRNEIQALLKFPFKDERKNALSGTFTWISQGKKCNVDEKIGTETNHVDFVGWNRNAAVSSLFYTLRDRYMLNINSRLESLYYDKQKWDKHYMVSSGWRFSNESLFRKFQFLNMGLIHAGVSYSEYHPVTDFHNYYTTYAGEVFYFQSYHSGLKLNLFKNRFQLSTNYYNTIIRTDNSNNFTVHKIQSKGWESMFQYDIIKTTNLTWKMEFNVAHNKYRILEAPGSGMFGSLENGNYVTRIDENKARGSIYGLMYEGVYATDQDAVALDKDGNVLYDGVGTPLRVTYNAYYGLSYTYKGGDAKYRDVNYDGLIDENDLVNLGNAFPRFTGGFGNTVQFKNFSFTCNFHFRSAYKVINQVAMASEGLFSVNNQSREELNRWQIQGQQGKYLLPRAFMGHPANNLGSDKYVENGGFLRMNYISLRYEFRPEICQKIHVKDLILSLSAQRIFTMTNYNGIDPEIEMESNAWYKDEIRVYPPKIYTISIQITI